MSRARGGNGGWSKRPTMVDVAREAGVALRTVSRVVNNDPTVGSAYVAKVQAAITALNFRPDERARQLRSGVTGTIGAAVRRIAEVNPALAAIEQTARATGLRLLASSTDFDESRERDILVSMCRQRLDGIIVEPFGNSHGYLEPELVAHGQPVEGLVHPGDITTERVAAALDTALHGTDPATALVTGNLDTTIAVLRRLGPQAASRLAIVGFDEVPLADLVQPALTVVAQDTATIGQTAVELLRARIADPSRAVQMVVVPVALKVRGSGERPASTALAVTRP